MPYRVILIFIICFLSVTAESVLSSADANNPTQLYWGDTHLHTSYSPDASLNGNTKIGPEQAFPPKKFFVAGDLDPDYVQDSYAKVNATLSLTSPDGKYRFSVIGKNLNDEQTSHQQNDIPLANFFGGKAGSYFSDPPRVVALQAEVNF